MALAHHDVSPTERDSACGAGGLQHGNQHGQGSRLLYCFLDALNLSCYCYMLEP